MKRPTHTSDDATERDIIDFLQDFLVKANEGIHDDLGKAEDYLNKHEIPTYITKKGLDITSVEENEDLTVEQVLEIGIHFGRYNTHKAWHEALEAIAEEHGMEQQTSGIQKKGKPEVKLITDVSQLPDEVVDALGDALGDLLKRANKKKGKS